MPPLLDDSSGLLLDLDGTLYTGDRLIPGAVEAVDALRARGVPFKFTTNTTTRSRQALLAHLGEMGLAAEADDFVTAPSAAVRYLAKKGAPRCFLLLREALATEFAAFPGENVWRVAEDGATDDPVDAVVIGDIGDRWDYALLDRAFKYLVGGAELIALHKGRYWERPDGLGLDIGAFVAGLEYASGREATVIGKPSAAFYRLAVDTLGLPPARVVMIGDDVESDVGGAQRAGLRGVLVRTGKYREALVAASAVKPDATLDSIAAIADLWS